MTSINVVRILKEKYDNSFNDDENLYNRKIKENKRRPLSASCSNMNKLGLNSTITGSENNSSYPRYLEVTKSSLIRMSHYTESIKHDTHKSDMYKPNELSSSFSQPNIDRNILKELNYKNNLNSLGSYSSI